MAGVGPQESANAPIRTGPLRSAAAESCRNPKRAPVPARAAVVRNSLRLKLMLLLFPMFISGPFILPEARNRPMAESRQFKKRVASQLTFQNLQPIIPVYQIELVVLVVVDIVA